MPKAEATRGEEMREQANPANTTTGDFWSSSSPPSAGCESPESMPPRLYPARAAQITGRERTMTKHQRTHGVAVTRRIATRRHRQDPQELPQGIQLPGVDEVVVRRLCAAAGRRWLRHLRPAHLERERGRASRGRVWRADPRHGQGRSSFTRSTPGRSAVTVGPFLQGRAMDSRRPGHG